MKCFVIAYNRLTWLKNICEYLADTGMEVIIIDNNSSYKPLLSWYDRCPYTLWRAAENIGHLVYWKSIGGRTLEDRYYCVTDHDLDLSEIPKDYISVLMEGLEKNPDVTKCGFSLRLGDLPGNDFTKKVIEWEKKFWKTKGNGFYQADIDTTFALYDKERDFGRLPPEGNKFFHAVRSPEPYTARHLPWYLTPEDILNNDEERYYLEHSNTYWGGKFKQTWKL